MMRCMISHSSLPKSLLGEDLKTVVYDKTMMRFFLYRATSTISRSRERRHTVLDDYIVFLQEHEDDIGLTKDDPINFCQAMQSSNYKKWIDAMKDELKSMQDNDVWDLIELLKDSKDNIKRYKARLVAKDFTQNEDIGYK
ncbi:hypothetical protein CR513_21004, partial [Mucuna pruriens]